MNSTRLIRRLNVNSELGSFYGVVVRENTLELEEPTTEELLEALAREAEEEGEE